MRTRVKICGITRPEDGLVAASYGADAIGLVFYEPSPRNVSVEQARAILQKLPPFVTVVGLFVNPTTERVWDVLDRVPLDVLQFHGDEKPEACERFDMPYIKALRVRAGDDLSVAIKSYSTAQGILLDTYVDDVAGGSGQTFDWRLVPDDIDKPVILAGGLTTDNVAQAVRQVQPYAVDVSGGVEVEKGIKDAAKIEAFLRAVNSAA